MSYIYLFYSETTPLQRGQTSAGSQCLRLIIINKQLYQNWHKSFTNIFTKEQKTYQSHCDKSHSILSQKQMCHSSLKQNYIQCITLF
jgi:hypothetical protein